MEKMPSKLFLLATIGLIALSYNADAFAESETIFSEDIIITDDTTITSGETWIVESGVTLSIQPHAEITFDAGSVLVNNGLIENKDDFIIQTGATLNNKGTINNYDMFENKGTLNNMDMGIINNYQETEFLIVGEVGILNNDGLIENRGNLTIQTGAIINNKGTINNYNWFENEGTLNNMDTGVINNNHESDFAVAIPTSYFVHGSSNKADDLIENKDGLIENKDGITIRISGYVQNKGIVNNDGLIENRGEFNHYNGLLKGEKIIHIQPGSFDDEGTLNDNSDSEIIAQEEKEPFCFLFWCW